MPFTIVQYKDDKGRVTIPKKFREALHIVSGVLLSITLKGETIHVTKLKGVKVNVQARGET